MKYNDWSEVNEKLRGLLSTQTFVILFINDQVYNYSLELKEKLKKTSCYKHMVKKITNDIEKEINRYNHVIYDVTKTREEAYAEITLSMEEDIQPHIERYNFTLSQILLDHGIDGEVNEIASLASTINMLTQISSSAIDDVGQRVRKVVLVKNPVRYLSLDKITYLTEQLTREVLPKDTVIDLNKEDRAMDAFMAITNNMLREETFDKAIERAG